MYFLDSEIIIYLAIIILFLWLVFVIFKFYRFVNYKYVQYKYKYQDYKYFLKKDEELRKYKSTSAVDKNQTNEQDYLKIVDVDKPIGFWTKHVLNQRMASIATMIKTLKENTQQGKNIGYWELKVTSERKIPGKFKNKTRDR